MFKKVFLLLLLFLLLGYQIVPLKPSDFYTINMVHEKFDDFFFIDDDFYYSAVKLYTFEMYPKFEKLIKEKCTNVPINDSVEYYGYLDQQTLFDLGKSGDQTWANIHGILVGQDIDTLNYSKVKLREQMAIVIGFYKNKQFMVADLNRNNDFSDDIKYEYDINFRNHPYDSINVIDKQPISEFIYEECYKGNIQKYNRRFVIYPDRNNPWRLDNNNPKKQREYFSLLKFRDYWKGEQIINNTQIEFYYHGYNNHLGIIYIKPKDIAFRKNDSGFNMQFKHRPTDTLSIAGSIFIIDSINRPISKLYLREIKKNTANFGYSFGEHVKDISFKDLQNKTFKLSDITSKKEYTLLEFWGTWCGPCVALTPKLVATQKKFINKLNIVSIAVDENSGKVKKYVTKHNLNWKQGYISDNKSWNNPIIKQLKVDFFPTFILLDKTGKIVLRGGSETFDDILNIIK